MRLLVILSPTEKWGTKTEYTRLRKFLHKDGYLRIAPEVYMRIVQNRKASELSKRAPPPKKQRTSLFVVYQMIRMMSNRLIV